MRLNKYFFAYVTEMAITKITQKNYSNKLQNYV